MGTFFALTKRNIKMFFKDKGMLFTSLITPIILLVLYATFLANVYRDSFEGSFPEGFTFPNMNKVINGAVSGQLTSSLLAVCCVTVAFCSNTLMANDKVTGVLKDLTITPLKRHTLALSYYFGTLATTLMVNAIALIACFIYTAINGWFMSTTDVLLLILDVTLLSMFGTALACFVNNFLKTQGQITAVGTIVSAGYGFICGAYMPIAQFGSVVQNIVSVLPGTYGTSLVKNHALNGVINEMGKNLSQDTINKTKVGMDCTPKLFGHVVNIPTMYIILISSTILLVAAYLLVNLLRKKAK